MKTYRKDVSDEEKDSFMAPHLAELWKTVVPRVKAGPEGAETGAGARVTSEERELLESILAKPNLSVTDRAGRLGLSAYKMSRSKRSVLKKGLAEQFSVNLGKEFGGNVSLMALTMEGYGVLGKLPANMPPKNVSLGHWWWQTQIAAHFNRKGIKAETEKSRGEARADVCLTVNGRDRAVEVEMTPKASVSSIVADLQSGFERVECYCKDRLVAREVTRLLEAYEGYEAIKDRVEVSVLSDLQLVKEIFGK